MCVSLLGFRGGADPLPRLRYSMVVNIIPVDHAVLWRNDAALNHGYDVERGR